ncbi:hypothetical protein F4604DRAFT_931821 [Suillus subluteus]|nr:hypothetical protein F4604DRAFT_931821 [Suillus subluteus]
MTLIKCSMMPWQKLLDIILPLITLILCATALDMDSWWPSLQRISWSDIDISCVSNVLYHDKCKSEWWNACGTQWSDTIIASARSTFDALRFLSSPLFGYPAPRLCVILAYELNPDGAMAMIHSQVVRDLSFVLLYHRRWYHGHIMLSESA